VWLDRHTARDGHPRSVTSIGFLLAEKTPGPFALEVARIDISRSPGR
jgi:hypothetical protein